MSKVGLEALNLIHDDDPRPHLLLRRRSPPPAASLFRRTPLFEARTSGTEARVRRTRMQRGFGVRLRA